MSDTPRTNNYDWSFHMLFAESQKMERELNAANERIKQLEEALGCVVVDCNHLHHRKKHQHRSGEPCPVEELIRKSKEAKP
jgi:hypothetical protein